MRLWLLSIGALGMAVCLGYGAGRIVSVLAEAPAAPVIREDIDPPRTAVVTFDSTVPVHGTMTGAVRVFLGDRLITSDEHGAFGVVPDSTSQPAQQSAAVVPPAGMRFVASRKGKKYYPVTTKAAAQIVVGNRIYFADAASAQKAGYHP